jgi:cytoskeletal protein CcmA (bactofilin family)
MTPFGRDQSPPPPSSSARSDETITLIGRATTVVGELSGTRGVRVEGTVKGTIDLKASFEVAEGAEVEAEVHATTVTIAGTVVGNVVASETVELQASAVVRGDVTATALHIVEGARLEGRVQMRAEDQQGRSPGPARTSQKTE